MDSALTLAWTVLCPCAAAARDRTDLRRFQRSYLIVTLMAMFADWIQGPYGYALYASYGYKQGEIAMLYMGGFLSSMVSPSRGRVGYP